MTSPSDATVTTSPERSETVTRGPWATWWHEHWSAVGKGTLAVVGFWWLVTGVIVALQRNEWTKLAA